LIVDGEDLTHPALRAPRLDVFLFGGNPRIKTSLLGGDFLAQILTPNSNSPYQLNSNQFLGILSKRKCMETIERSVNNALRSQTGIR
jgi:hypothetical protein